MSIILDTRISAKEKIIRNKGENKLDFPQKFIVIDIETTGFDPQFDEIIEIAAIKVENEQMIERFNTLIKPRNKIDEYISKLTGITNEMVENEPVIEEVIGDFYKFIGNNILIGHNINFDLNFLYDELIKLRKLELNNDFVDTMKIGRYLLKDLKHHRLIDLANNYNISVSGSHRALKDCEITLAVYNSMLKDIIEKYESIENFTSGLERKNSSKRKIYKLDIESIKTDKMEFDISHPLYQQRCVFTGTLEKMTRKEAMKNVVDFGGICANTITKETNYLILGNNEYNPLVKDGKSKKQKKAEELKIKGYDIEIISENIFYEMIECS